MTRERVWIFAFIMAFTVGVVILWRVHGVKSHVSVPTVKETEEITKTLEKNEVADATKEVITSDGITLYENAKYLTVEKVIRTTVETEDGTSETKYDTYLVSDVDLVNGKDQTEEYAKALDVTELDDSKVEQVAFLDSFGVSYENQNGWEVYENLLAENGICVDINQAVFDQETYEMTKQKRYMLKDSACTMFKEIEDAGYDQLLNQKLSYQVATTEDGIQIPDSFLAEIRYKVGERTVTKSMFIQVAINNWNTEGE
ncbi:MAG: hypothetical protein PHW47_08035 [Lachnospira sp.]|nr:hypothetical protein [Lachnospira sp.]